MAPSGDGGRGVAAAILVTPTEPEGSMPLQPIDRSRTRRAPASIFVALVAALSVALLGASWVGPRPAFGADPAAPSAVPTPSPSPTPAPTPVPTPPPPPGLIILGPTITFFGRGYGHGVGLSQYGARGRALAGQTATAILAHYYRGAALGTLAPSARIRVLILHAWTATPAVPLIVYGRLTPWTIDGIAKVFPRDAMLRLIPTTTSRPTGLRTTWRLRITAVTGALLHDAAAPASLVVRGTADTGRLQLWSKPGAYDRYRGILRILPAATTPTVTVVDELPLEAYLRGVVPAEMPAAWPAAALQAQSIASRSYAARRLRPGVSYYDVPDTSSSQVYLGVLAERAASDAAIAATSGVVLRSGVSIANTLFHSTGGGATEDNENVYTSSTGAKVAGPVGYRRGSSDRAPDGTSYDKTAPFAMWATRTYPAAQVSGWFAADPRTAVGTLTAIDLRDHTPSGRLISVTLIGSGGTKKVSGEVFRLVFNAARPVGDPMLRSTLFATGPIP
jgi:stage II sporulation protein D